MTKKLYFGNLPYQLGINELRDLVGEHAEVVSVLLPRNRETGDRRGFAFVELPAEAAETVIGAFHGRVIHGRTLSVSEARPPGQTLGRLARGQIATRQTIR